MVRQASRILENNLNTLEKEKILASQEVGFISVKNGCIQSLITQHFEGSPNSGHKRVMARVVA
jgi:hypothetical protein